jgi:tight adherence protein C
MTAILRYPEFAMAGILSIALLLGLSKDQDWHWPFSLSRPAAALALLLPESYLTWINKTLLYADWRTNSSFGDFASFKIYPALSSMLSSFFLPLPAVCLLAFVAWFVPDLLLIITVKRRQEEIRQALPQALDLMVLCVDAGLGLDATLQRISAETSVVTSALNEELKLLGREVLLGVDRDRAYQDLFTRNGVDELKTLGSALNQASKLGLSVAKILRAQSEFIRKKRAQNAEEKALKMPILMAFPLWFCIMPSLMLLVLGPSLIRFYYSLHAARGF